MADAASRTTGQKAAQPGDMTALRKQAQEDQRDADAAKAAAEAAAAAEVESYEKKNVVIDYTNVDQPLPEVIEDQDDERPIREVIIKYDIDQMSFGVKILKEAQFDENGAMTVPPVVGGINFLSFQEGRRYRLPKPLADHLDERGLIFH